MSRRRKGSIPPFAPDGNGASYNAEADGRNATGEHLVYIPLRCLLPSPYQPRLLFDVEADRELAADIAENGLVHVPVARPAPGAPGMKELVAGERRTRALRRLAAEGCDARGALRPPLDPDGGPGDWLVKVLIEDLSDAEACARAYAENVQREGLKAWERVRAVRLQERLQAEAGQSTTVRAIAAERDDAHSTIGPYVQIARALTDDVLRLIEDPEAGCEAEVLLCRLSAAALTRAASAPTAQERAERLRRELARVDEHGNRRRKPASKADTPTPTIAAEDRPLQVNTRKPISALAGTQAWGYVERLLPALIALADQASSVDVRAATVAAFLRAAKREADAPRPTLE